MTNTRRGTTASHGSAPRIPTRKSRVPAVEPQEPSHPTLITNASQDGNYCRSSGLRLLLFDGTKRDLPEILREQVGKYDPNAAVKREWTSVTDVCDAYDVIVDHSDDIEAALRREDEIWKRRVRKCHAIRPAYLVISKIGQYRLARFHVERMGGHFLHLCDVSSRFGDELEQIRLRIGYLQRSLPRWLITNEGNDRTLQASVSFLGPRGWQLVRAEDGLAAELAVLITRNGIPRSIAGWRKIIMDSSLFKPSGGCFNVPSRTTLRMHIHRDYIKALQQAFDEARAGYRAERVLERVRLGEKTVGYRIKGRVQ